MAERFLAPDEPLAERLTDAIRSGDVTALRTLLASDPGLATVRLGSADGARRTLLHVATDWPGPLPNGREVVEALVAAGADPNARFAGPHQETPLHWAASCDDVAVIDALLDAGADLEARGAVIGGGTAMADATAFGQWAAARRLRERGASTTFWEAAALGLDGEVEAALQDTVSTQSVTEALWGACHGGHLTTAQRLVAAGADVSWVGWDDLAPLDVAMRAEAADVVAWLRSVGARPARGAHPEV